MTIILLVVKMKDVGISSGSESDENNGISGGGTNNGTNNGSGGVSGDNGNTTNPDQNNSTDVVPPNNSTGPNSSMPSPYAAYPDYLKANKALYTWSHSV